MEKYDYHIDISLLPVSDNLKEYLEKIIYWHDEALNWNDPSGDLLWTQKQKDAFFIAAKTGYDRLRSELCEDYEIVFEESLII